MRSPLGQMTFIISWEEGLNITVSLTRTMKTFGQVNEIGSSKKPQLCPWVTFSFIKCLVLGNARHTRILLALSDSFKIVPINKQDWPLNGKLYNLWEI